MNTKIIKIVALVISVLFLSICLLLFLTYITPTQSPIVKKFASVLPAMMIDDEIITVGEIAENVEATRQFYENQNFSEVGIRIDFGTTDGQKRLKIIEREVINNLAENLVIEDIVRDTGQRVDKESVAMALSRTIKEGGDIDFAKERAGLYGWTLEKFARKVIKPSLYREKIEEIFAAQNVASEEQWRDIRSAQKMIADGRAFAEAAQTYSEGSTADKGGVLGLFRRDQLDTEIAEVAFGLEKGVTSEAFETSYGIHLLLVDDIILDDAGAKDMVSLNHIYLKKETLSDFLNEAFAERSIRSFLPGYTWDGAESYIVFTDGDLIAFEQKIIDDAQAAIKESIEEIANEEAALGNDVLSDVSPEEL